MASKVTRIFYAHSAQEDFNEINGACEEIARVVKKKSPDEVAVVVIPGRTDFEQYFGGDWDAWTRSVSQRRDSITLEPFYHLIIVPSEYVGRATASIVDVAVRAGFPVLLFQNGKMSRITQVKTGDPDDWQGGFELRHAPAPASPDKPWSGKGQQLELPLAYKEDPHGNSNS